jgi:general secretion pathway protein C
VVSPLQIKLLGTVVSETRAAAIIATAAGRQQRVFFIGDSIQPGVTLKTVEAAAIVVDRGGRLERVSLAKGTPLVSAPMPAIHPVRRPPPSPMPAYSPAGAMRRNINRQHLQQQLKNFPALLSQARVIPRMVNGKPSGFTISEIAPGSLYQQAGLRNGDIILSVNGKRITDASQAMTMYQTLKNAPALDLVLIRAGQTQQVHYDIR